MRAISEFRNLKIPSILTSKEEQRVASSNVPNPECLRFSAFLAFVPEKRFKRRLLLNETLDARCRFCVPEAVKLRKIVPSVRSLGRGQRSALLLPVVRQLVSCGGDSFRTVDVSLENRYNVQYNYNLLLRTCAVELPSRREEWRIDGTGKCQVRWQCRSRGRKGNVTELQHFSDVL